jgi:hypothetical protein
LLPAKKILPRFQEKKFFPFMAVLFTGVKKIKNK